MHDGDDDLGMGREISRRDFINGVGGLVAGATLTGCAGTKPASTSEIDGPPTLDPPLRQGLRGSQPGSYEVAHQLAWERRTDWGPVHEAEPETYDLVIVGGGISGLSAAWFEIRRNESARILILENHDDFGGHARRNEFRVGDEMILGYGGSQTLESPQRFSETSKSLLQNLGIEFEAFDAAYDRGFYRRHGLAGGTFFDRSTYGVDRLVPYAPIDYAAYLPLPDSPLEPSAAVARMPLSAPARVEMLRLLEAKGNRLGEKTAVEQADYLYGISYRTFLERHLGISQPEVFALLEGISTDLGLTLDTATAMGCLDYLGLPGRGITQLEPLRFEDDPYIAHFPDGNASVARLLVRSLMPHVATGSTATDVIGASFDYGRLDEATAQVRLRLESTVVGVTHDGDAGSAESVAVTYVRGERPFRVRARKCVLACYNAMIPHLCPELPAPQREALSLAVKVPILYSTVVLRNWHAWEELGVGAAVAPGSYHQNAILDFPVSMGGYAYSSGPDEPIVVHMERFGKAPTPGLPPREQYRTVRRDLYTTSFEHIEREIRTHLAGMLSGAGFDPAVDIEAITVNRWAHGYAYGYNSVFDAFEDGEQAPHVIGRAGFGRIAIANSDAGGRAMIDTAIDEAHRAVGELSRF